MMSDMKHDRRLTVVAVLAIALLLASQSATAGTLVVCAPGYPGSTAEAQPAMDAFAEALAADGLKLSAVYFEREDDGVAALEAEDTNFAMVTLPFFLEHRIDLGLKPIAQAIPEGSGANQQWALVAPAGRIENSQDLDGWEIISIGGHSPAFVRSVVFDGWGPAPTHLDIVFSSRVLTALRRAAKGENVAVLLDGPQAESIERLPFGKELEVVRAASEVPVSLVCSVGGRLDDTAEKAFTRILLGLGSEESAREALAGIRIERFAPVDRQALEGAIEAFEQVGPV